MRDALGQYKFTSFVLCKEVVLFSEVVSVLKLWEDNFLGPQAVSLVERSFIVFLGGSTIGGVAVHVFLLS